MATRLDRLFLLLDTGSTAVVRKSAAEQLGEVQKLHPHELNNLLSKVHGYLCSNSWDTRIAAGQAVQAIAKNVPQWDPQGNNNAESCCSPIPTSGCLPLSNFSIDKVLEHGVSLMASEGTEFDLEDEATLGMDQKEHLARQKQMLNKRLGLDVAGGMGMNTDELYEEEDLIINKPDSMATNQACVKEILSHQLSSGSQDFLSARERNRAKRKAKLLCRQVSRDETGNGEPSSKHPRRTASVIMEQGDKLLMDNMPDNTLNMDEMEEWPFEAFCELLEAELFSACWERRHGAATGLREVIKLHGHGAGRNSDASKTQMCELNQLWLEDLALRLICVLALDRFGDFVSDEVVAPVRETCAQALGVTIQALGDGGVQQVVQVLLQLQGPQQWEVRHGGLLGLKYVLAVRQDLAGGLLNVILPAIFGGLQDSSDDVRGVAAAALCTVTQELVDNFPQQAHMIVECLWHTLLDLDDLTASTNSIMALLAALLNHPNVNSQSGIPLEHLVPRLWPFLKHSIRSVRRATLETLLSLVCAPHVASWLPAVMADALRLIYQRCLLEAVPEILNTVQQVWSCLLKACSADDILLATSPFLGSWLCLSMQAATLPFDTSFLLDPKHPERGNPRDLSPGRQRHLLQLAEEAAARRLYIGGATSLSDPPAKRDASVVLARSLAAKCLGMLCQHLCEATPLPGADTPPMALAKLLIFHLNSKSAIQRLVVADILMHWTLLQQSSITYDPSVVSRLHECLTEAIYFDEIALPFTRMQTECKNFIASLREQKLALGEAYNVGMVLSLEQCQALCTHVYDSVRAQLKTRHQTTFDERRKQLQLTVEGTALEQQTLNIRVQQSLASVVVVLRSLPNQMNPVVRPLMETIKKESSQQLQENAAVTLSRLVQLCINRASCPTPKIIKNLCTTLCSDPTFTPPVILDTQSENVSEGREAYCDTYSGILTLNAQQKTPCVPRGRRPAVLKKVASISVDISLDDIDHEQDQDRRSALIGRRGSSMSLCQIARDLGPRLLMSVPQLWNAMLGPLQHFKLTPESRDNIEAGKELINSLCVLEVVGPSLHEQLHTQLVAMLPQLVLCLEHPLTAVRHMCARVLGMLSKLCPSLTLHGLLQRVLPLLAASDSVTHRQGAIEAIATVIESLQLGIVPYLVLIVVPVLGRMSDQDTATRLMATTCFGNLIRLMPLEAGVPCPSDLPPALAQQRDKQRAFLEQLLDASKITAYNVPVPVAAQLRAYQQDGVNWLAFLNTYQLHGILCDDMGLGKTLQSICILAGDHHNRMMGYKDGGRADCAPLPSLVVCPPTLTGHWVDEISKFVTTLDPLHYVGPPAERARLQKKAKDHNLVIASYDVVRNDISFFGKQHWNYCILDEGHIIKNNKTKLSRAVKQLSCNHRLILSGTPIQNNVLELWSLFDFLMPGFLGTERQFHARYGRPILLSRDPRSSQADQEAGALAMEALHRQVLPFVLRRMKEDVLKDLPPKIIQDYYCDPSPLQVELYEDFAKSRAASNVEGGVSGESTKPTTHIFQALQYLRKVCNHPALVLTPAHPEYTRITSQLKRDNSRLRALQHAPKLTALKQLLMDCGIGVAEDNSTVAAVGQHRVLLFCQLKAMLDIVENDLFKAEMPDVTFLRLDGTVPAANRHGIVNRFNNDPSIDVLLLTTHVGGLGLNLTGADTVVFVEHDWNPSKDLQAMDRAHRIGQKKVVNVYRLITRGTLEEKIMGLQKFKMNIANTIISAENSSLASMGTDQLLDLFSLGSEEGKGSKEAEEGGSAKSVLENMGELWDEQQYDTEYNLDNFMQSLRK